MNLLNHLQELRARIIICFVAFVICFILSWLFKEKILNLLTLPVSPYLHYNDGKLIFTAPMDEFLSFIKLSGFSALAMVFPVLLYHTWGFLAPGLYKRERNFILLFSFLGALLFLMGILFIYVIVYPLTFKFLIGGTASLAMISIKEYLSFYIQTSLAFGLLFETPLIIVGLVYMGIVSVQQLKKSRPYIVIILAVLSALMTPPDVLSMLFLLGPLYLLFEASLILSSWISQSKASS